MYVEFLIALVFVGAGVIMSASTTEQGLRDTHKKWCIEKAQTKEEVLRCDKFPWEEQQ